MKIQGLKIKNAGFEDLQQEGAGETSVADELKSEVDEALVEVQQFKEENGEYLSEENLVELERIETMLKAESAAIDAWGIGGAEGGAGVEGEYAMWDIPEGLDPGWNGIPDDFIWDDADDAARLADDPEWYGEYAGTIQIPNSGDPMNPTKFGFQMTDDMIGVFAESRGHDMIITVVYEDQTRESWIVEDGCIRTEPFLISAAGLSHGATIDCHRLFRQHDNIWIHGTEHDDDIRGSQSNDIIVAYAGNDIISAEAGDDMVWGDEGYDYAGMADQSYGGHDTLDGGAGNDQIYAGGGSDTVFSSDEGETVAEWETKENNISAIPPSPDQWLDGYGSWEVSEIEEGMVTVSNMATDGTAGQIDIHMEGMPGYNMAFGEMGTDGSLIVTFVGEEGTFKVKFEDFFDAFLPAGGDPRDAIATFNLIGTEGSEIFNFDKITINETNSQVINLLGGAGEDIVLGVHNDMIKNGVSTDPNEILESTESPSMLGSHVNSGVFTSSDDLPYADADHKNWCGYKSEVNTDGQVYITADTAYDGDRAEVLHLKVPEGYDTGYIAQDTEGNMYVIAVKATASGEADTMVFKIDKDLVADGLGYNEILVQSSGNTTVGAGDASSLASSNPIPLVAISLDENDYMTSGGDGDDLVFLEEGAKKSDSENEIVWQTVETAYSTYTGSGNASPGIGGESTSGAGEGEGTGAGEETPAGEGAGETPTS